MLIVISKTFSQETFEHPQGAGEEGLKTEQFKIANILKPMISNQQPETISSNGGGEGSSSLQAVCL